jgi:integrase
MIKIRRQTVKRMPRVLDLQYYRDERFKAHTQYKRQRTIASWNREAAVLRRIFNIALQQGWILKNPFKCGDPLILTSAERRREKILSAAEERRMLEACNTHDYRKHLKPLLIYPEIGSDVPNAVEVLKKLNENKVKIILWTIRSGEYLEQAVNWFEERGIELWSINKNPQQRFWSKSPKAYAPVYIDDAAPGCPLKFPEDSEQRVYADWFEIERLLEEIGYL